MRVSAQDVFAIAYVHGVAHDIEELAWSGSVPHGKVQELISHGLRSFRASDQPPWRLGEQAARESLSMADVTPDLLVFASDTELDAASSLARLAIELDLSDIRSMALAGHECANLGNLVMVAEDALANGRHRCALLVTADSVLAKPRMMSNGISVFSDGAAALMMMPRELTPPHAPIRASVTTIAMEVDLSAWRGSQATRLVNTAELAGRLTDRLRERTGPAESLWRYVILPNYQAPTQLFLASALGITPEQILTGDVAGDAHCFGADVLVTFAQAHRRLLEEEAGPIALVAPGPYCWFLLELECA